MWGVKIDRLLYQAKAQGLGIEVHILLRIGRYSRHVMKPAGVYGQDLPAFMFSCTYGKPIGLGVYSALAMNSSRTAAVAEQPLLVTPKSM